jgi:hypothetical protein
VTDPFTGTVTSSLFFISLTEVSMPNHVTHRLRVTGPIDDVAAFKQLAIVEDKDAVMRALQHGGEATGSFDAFDFNQVIPRPPILDLVISPVRKGENGRTMLYVADTGTVFANTREATEEEQTILDAIPEGDWYNWSIEHWGTKWNAYDFQPVIDQATYEFTFNTAWSPPGPVLDTLAQRFPNVSMDVAWFDEGSMHAGQGVLQGQFYSTDALYVDPTPEIYERVYGERMMADEELDELYVLDTTDTKRLMIADNFTNYDVGSSMDANGNFPLTSISYSDDPVLDDDHCDDIRRYRDKIAAKLELPY